MKYYQFFLFTLLFVITCQAQQDNFSHFSFKLKIDPHSQNISTSLNLSYTNHSEDSDSAVFLLHKNLLITSVTGEEVKSFNFDTVTQSQYPFAPEAGRLKIIFKREIPKNEMTGISIKYSGRIGIVSQWQNNRITEDWIELGMYAPWFPYNPKLNKFTFFAELEIDEDYKILSNGNVEQKNGIWILSSGSLTNDIVILASKNFVHKNIDINNSTINLISTVPLSDSTSFDILKSCSKIFQSFNNWFGLNDNSKFSIVIAPREIGGGYSRKGFIVLNKIDDIKYNNSKENYTRYFAHEISHFWWANSPSDSWEDWLNESFAEYSAMMAIRHIYNRNVFEERINKKINQSRNF